ncbi:uncharacterized protein LOC144623228 isoform X2 [Crassostrea virginica]
MFRGTPTRGINLGGFSIQRDPNTWLETVGLAEYKANFRRNHIKTVRDMEALKSFTEKEIREDLHITNPGHIQRIKDAIVCLSNPTKGLVFLIVFVFSSSYNSSACSFIASPRCLTSYRFGQSYWTSISSGPG